MNATMTSQTAEEAGPLTAEEQAFIEAFEACTLPPDRFRHRDHVRLGWLYFRLYPVPAALARYVEGLKRFADEMDVAL